MTELTESSKKTVALIAIKEQETRLRLLAQARGENHFSYITAALWPIAVGLVGFVGTQYLNRHPNLNLRPIIPALAVAFGFVFLQIFILCGQLKRRVDALLKLFELEQKTRAEKRD